MRKISKRKFTYVHENTTFLYNTDMRTIMSQDDVPWFK